MKMENSLVFVSPVSRIIKQKKIVSEGGVARYYAWDNRIRAIRCRRENTQIIELTGRKRLFRLMKLYILSKEKRLFFLYPYAGIRLDRKGFVYEILSIIFIILMRYCSCRNQVILDISDLKYEQSLDLELDSLDSRALKIIEKILFSGRKFYFIFASESMREFAVRKYKIPKDRACTCINGGDIIERHSDRRADNVIKYVYSGTLNKGRNIKRMIDSFPDKEGYQLILMGTDGDWLENIVKKRSNIKYLGAIAEQEAHEIVSFCDVGLIPYDEHRLYYNIAYPTKLSFYITAGISYLATPTQEIKRLDYDFGYVCRMDDWKNTILNMEINDLNEKKKKIAQIRERFSWDVTLSCLWIDKE